MAKKPNKKQTSAKKQSASPSSSPREPKAGGSPKWLQPLLIHGGIILGFLVILFLYFSPVLKGEILYQNDIFQYKGMSKEVTDFYADTGEEALWTGTLFSGMPAFQMGTRHPNNLVVYLHKALNLVPRPVSFIFLLFLGFYFLLNVLKLDRWLSAIGAIAFSLSSSFFIIVEAGHTSKVMAIAYMAPTLAGVILAYRGKWLTGGAVTALFLSLQLFVNHFQITYYLAFMIGFLIIAYGVVAVREQKIPDFIKASLVLLVAALLAVGPNTGRLWTTAEYAAETMRGPSELTPPAGETQSSGLDKEYAYRWSYGISETFTLLIPNFLGGASNSDVGENSETFELLSGLTQKSQAKQIVAGWPTYWGDQPGTSGPVYVGAIVCFLFVLSLFMLKGPLKWGLLAVTLLTIMLSWGRNFAGFSDLFFDYFPIYSKFRAVSMLLTVAQITLPLLGMLGLWKILTDDKSKLEANRKHLLMAAGITGGLALVIALLGPFFMDFATLDGSPYNSDVQSLTRRGIPENMVPQFLDALYADRASMLRMDGLRSALFILIAGGLIWLYLKDSIKKNLLYIGLGVAILLDMMPIDRRFLDSENFIRERAYAQRMAPSPASQQILQDKDPHYRVLNLSTNTFNDAMTSYHHKHIGGYHAAKLSRYQDLISRQIQPNIQQLAAGLQRLQNTAPTDSLIRSIFAPLNAINMLNTRYIILQADNPPLRNPSNLGTSWFIQNIVMAENADDEIAKLSTINVATTAVVDKRFQDQVSGFQAANDPAASIRFVSYSPKHMVYETNSTQAQIAIFSEIYYNDKKGWKAYVDNESVPHFRANYVLRGLQLPAGKHTVEFKFEPRSYLMGETLSLIFSLLLFIAVAGTFYWNWRTEQNEIN